MQRLGESRVDAVLGFHPKPVTTETWRSYTSLIDPRTRQAFLHTLRAVVADQRDEMARLTTSLARAAEGLEATTAAAGPELSSAAARADTLLAQMEATTARLDAVLLSLDTVMGRMARGEGTLGRLSQDEALWDNANAAFASLNELLIDLRQNPDRYLKIEIF